MLKKKKKYGVLPGLHNALLHGAEAFSYRLSGAIGRPKHCHWLPTLGLVDSGSTGP
jgi:hypothetical protein